MCERCCQVATREDEVQGQRVLIKVYRLIIEIEPEDDDSFVIKSHPTLGHLSRRRPSLDTYDRRGGYSNLRRRRLHFVRSRP